MLVSKEKHPPIDRMTSILTCKCFKTGKDATGQDATQEINIFWKGGKDDEDGQGQIIIESQDTHVIDCNSFGVHGETLGDSIDYFSLTDTLEYLGYTYSILHHSLDQPDEFILDTPIRSLRNMQVTVK
jgi:hypothetical protein